MIDAVARRSLLCLAAATPLILSGCSAQIAQPNSPPLVSASPAVFNLRPPASVITGAAGGAETGVDGVIFYWVTSPTAVMEIYNPAPTARLAHFAATFSQPVCSNTVTVSLTDGTKEQVFKVAGVPVTKTFDKTVPANGSVQANLRVDGQPCHAERDPRDLYVMIRELDARFD